MEKKKKTGLIIGLIILVLAIIGVVVTVLLLFLNNKDETESPKDENTISSAYSSALKDLYGDARYMIFVSFIDLNNDDTPEMIFKDDEGHLGVYTLNEKNKARRAFLINGGEFVLAYDIEKDEVKWFFVYGNLSGYTYYDMNVVLENMSLDEGVPVTVDNLYTKYLSLKATIDYDVIEDQKWSSHISAALLKTNSNYTIGRSLEDIKKDLEENNIHKFMYCSRETYNPSKREYYYKDTHIYNYDNNGLYLVDYVASINYFPFESDIDKEGYVNSVKDNLDNRGFDVEMIKESPSYYVLKYSVKKSDFYRININPDNYDYYSFENQYENGKIAQIHHIDMSFDCRIE